jgi:hypothetical protein
MWGMSSHPPETTTDPRPGSRPTCRHSLVRPFDCVYNLLPTNGLYTLSCFLALFVCSSLTDVQTVLLEPDVAFGLLTCEYAATLDLYLVHVLMPMYHFIAPLLVAHRPFSPS